MGKLTNALKSAGKAAGKVGKEAYNFGQRIEFAPEDRRQKAEYLFGMRDKITAKPPAKKKKAKTKSGNSKKKTGTARKKTFTPIKTVQQPKKQTLQMPSMPAQSVKTKPDAYVKVGSKFGSSKRVPVTYKRPGASKYNREWFNTTQEAEMFARNISNQYGVGVTYE